MTLTPKGGAFALLFLASLGVLLRDIFRRSVCGEDRSGWLLGLVVGCAGMTVCVIVATPLAL